MNPEPRTGRAGDILGRQVRGSDGRLLGRIADLIIETTPSGEHRVVAALVVAGRWGRLLGYERDETTGPWILEHLARIVLRRNTTEVPWTALRFDDIAPIVR